MIHYSAAETDTKAAVKQKQAWTKDRVTFLAGKPGSAAYWLSQVGEAEEIKESLLTPLDIADKNGVYFVSVAKAAWMRLQLAAQSIVAFAQAA